MIPPPVAGGAPDDEMKGMVGCLQSTASTAVAAAGLGISVCGHGPALRRGLRQVVG